MPLNALDLLQDAGLVAVRVTGDAWPRGLLSESPIPDTWMALVLTASGRTRYAPAGEDPRAGRDDRLLLVRNRAITVPFELAEMPAQCGNLVHVRGELLLRWRAREADLAALAAWLPAGEPLTLAALASRVGDRGGNEALRRFVLGQPAATLVQQDVRDALRAALRDGLKRLLFESGAELERVATAVFESRTLRLQQARERDAAERVQAVQARQAVEAAASEAMRQRLAGLGGVLEKLKAAAGTGDGSIQDLLPALSPTERGRLLENLWRVTPNRRVTQAVVVAAGQELLWFEPGAAQPARRAALPDDLGGLRSIAPGSAADLLIGAATGVWRVRGSDGEILTKFAVPDAPPQRTGFNAMTVAGEWLYATHSGLGCRRWRVGAPGEPPQAILEPKNGAPRGVRSLIAAESGDVLFAADEAVHVVRPGTETSEALFEVAAIIHALAADERTLYAGAADGMLLRTTLDTPEDIEVIHRAREAIETIGVRRWFDLVEVVIPVGEDGVLSLYGDDAVAVRVMQPGAPVRRVWTADDALAALSETRDRVFVLAAASASPVEIAVGRLTGRSVQDVCLVPAPGPAAA